MHFRWKVTRGSCYSYKTHVFYDRKRERFLVFNFMKLATTLHALLCICDIHQRPIMTGISGMKNVDTSESEVNLILNYTTKFVNEYNRIIIIKSFLLKY